jgi:hypothetical protein
MSAISIGESVASLPFSHVNGETAPPDSAGLRRRLMLSTADSPPRVWHDSTTDQLKFQPMSRKQATILFHEARKFERQTRSKGRQDGRIGRNGILVLHALLFDFLNYRSGALFPSRAKIAEKAAISLSSVDRGLKKLKAAGMLNWVRRCTGEYVDGQFQLRQQSSAYVVLPVSQWRGYSPSAPCPVPEGISWGAAPPLPDVITLACQEPAGGSVSAKVAVLASDPGDKLAASLARLGQAMLNKRSRVESAGSAGAST